MTPGSVKLLGSPSRAGGLPFVNYRPNRYVSRGSISTRKPGCITTGSGIMILMWDGS